MLGRFEAQRGGSHEPGLTVRVTQGLLRICLGCCGYEMVFAFFPVSPQSPDFQLVFSGKPVTDLPSFMKDTL